MKWIALSICLMGIIPLSAFLRRNPRQRAVAWMSLGLLPFFINYFHLFMAMDAAPEWGGYVRGFEISILDVITLALYFNTDGGREPLPFRFVMTFYFVTVVLSAFQSWYPKESLFYPWQLARMFLLYATVVRGCCDPRVTPAIMTGMGASIILEAGFAIWQRFGVGMTQTGGTEGHQNLLGVMSHFVILPFFALLLSGRRGMLPIAVVLAGALVVVSTASRATIGLEAFGFATIYLFSAARKWTPRKQRVLMMGMIAMALIVPAVTTSFQQRFAKVSVDETLYDERAAYIKAAEMMLSDYPLGIGANQFAVIGNTQHYYEKAGINTYWMNLAGNVHNIYYLVAAETGYPGVFALLLLLGYPLMVAFRCGWRNLGDYRGDLLLGLGVALLTVYLHSWVEWSLATVPAEYLLAITIGLVAGNARQLRYWSIPNRNAVRAVSSQSEARISTPKSLSAESGQDRVRVHNETITSISDD